MLSAGSLFLIASLLLSEPARFHPSAIPPHALAAVAYLVVFGSIVGFSAYAWLLRNAPLPLISTYAYVNPVVAILVGWLLGGEELTQAIVGGMLVILAGVALVRYGGVQPATARPAPAELPTKEEALIQGSVSVPLRSKLCSESRR